MPEIRLDSKVVLPALGKGEPSLKKRRTECQNRQTSSLSLRRELTVAELSLNSYTIKKIGEIAQNWKEIARGLLNSGHEKFADVYQISMLIAQCMEQPDKTKKIWERIFVCEDIEFKKIQSIALVKSDPDGLCIAHMVTHPHNMRSPVNQNEQHRVEGSGSKIISHLKKLFSDTDPPRGIYLEAVKAAEPFYIKQGFRRLDSFDYLPQESDTIPMFWPPHMTASSFNPLPKQFGASEWLKYFEADIGISPPLPTDIDAILDSPCPEWPDKKVKSTHMLVLIPQTVNGEPWCVKRLQQLVKKPLKMNLESVDDGLQTASVSHWVLILRDIIRGSESKTYEEHVQCVQDLHQRTGIEYQVPRLLEALTCMCIERKIMGESLYEYHKRSSRTQDEIEHCHLCFGEFSKQGSLPHDIKNIFTINDSDKDPQIGVAAIRQL